MHNFFPHFLRSLHFHHLFSDFLFSKAFHRARNLLMIKRNSIEFHFTKWHELFVANGLHSLLTEFTGKNSFIYFLFVLFSVDFADASAFVQLAIICTGYLIVDSLAFPLGELISGWSSRQTANTKNVPISTLKPRVHRVIETMKWKTAFILRILTVVFFYYAKGAIRLSFHHSLVRIWLKMSSSRLSKENTNKLEWNLSQIHRRRGIVFTEFIRLNEFIYWTQPLNFGTNFSELHKFFDAVWSNILAAEYSR